MGVLTGDALSVSGEINRVCVAVTLAVGHKRADHLVEGGHKSAVVQVGYLPAYYPPRALVREG